MARLRHPAGALGRLRQRLQDAGSELHGVGDLGVQAVVGQGPGLRGQPGAAVLLERRDSAVQPRTADGRRRLPEPPGPGDHGRLHGDRRTTRRARTCWSGRRRRGRCRPTRRSRSTRTSSTCSCSRGSSAMCWPRRGWPPTRASSAKSPRSSATYTGRDLLGTRYLPPFPYFMDSPNAFQVLPGDFVSHRGRHRHRAHVAGLRRGRHGDRRRRRTSSRSRPSTPRAGSTRRCPTTPASTSSTPTRRSSAT